MSNLLILCESRERAGVLSIHACIDCIGMSLTTIALSNVSFRLIKK